MAQRLKSDLTADPVTGAELGSGKAGPGTNLSRKARE